MTEIRTPASRTLIADYRKLVRRRRLVVVMLVAGIAAALLADLVTGPSSLPIIDALRSLFGGSDDPVVDVIVREVRLPSALLAVAAGAALGLAGAEMQTTLNNPLASPFTLGISSAAVFGAALAIVLGWQIPGVPADWMLPVNAFLMALAAIALLLQVGRSQTVPVETLVLFGTALFFTGNAAVAILQYVASPDDLQQLVFWTMGSLGRATIGKVGLVVLAILLVLPFAVAASWRLTALRMGEERARSLGVDVLRLRRASLLRVAVLTATAVAFTGTIPFVGLVGPHIARMLVGEDHRFLLPASALSGGLLLALASVVSKVAVPGAVLPVGLVTALIGVPFFVSLLLTGRDRR